MDNNSVLNRYSRFEEDIRNLLDRIGAKIDSEIKVQIDQLGIHLIELYRRKLVKINHSVMELICAKALLQRNYIVKVEHILDNSGLTCDLYGEKGEGVLIIEIETGYTPPNHALDPISYNRARIASKIARYSFYSNKFAIGVPIYNILQIPAIFNKPPRDRSDSEVKELKNLCDKYYTKPPITLRLLREANLQSIYVIDIDKVRFREIDPEEYQVLAKKIQEIID